MRRGRGGGDGGGLDGRERGEGGDFRDEFSEIIAGGDERIAQTGDGGGAVGAGSLLHEVVEKLLDEGAVGAFARDGKLGDIARAGEADGGVLVVAVVARSVDGATGVIGAVAADGVEVL